MPHYPKTLLLDTLHRGGMLLSELVETCRNHDFTDVIVLHEHRGEPGAY